MKKRGLTSLLFAAVLGIAVAAPHLGAQDSIPPIQVGGGQSVTRVTNGQTVQVTASDGVSVQVYFYEISSSRIDGVAVRSSGGSSAGTVTIRWVSRLREVTLQIGPPTPEVPFTMEGGDIDKRTGNVISP